MAASTTMSSSPLSAAFQGVPGAFSFEACRACLPDANPVGHDTFEQAFEAVSSGACEVGFIPIRNSTAGPVPEVAVLLPASGLEIVAEHPWLVRLQLMACPGATLDRIELISSHPMALKQCTRLLEELGLPTEPAFDTAGAAAELARSGDTTRAVVAARAAAELYGLMVLRADVEDRADNTTWFVVLRRKATAAGDR